MQKRSAQNKIEAAVQEENAFIEELVSVLRLHGDCELRHLSAQFRYRSEPQSPDVLFIHERKGAPAIIVIEVDFANPVSQSGDFLREKRRFVAEGSEIHLQQYVLLAPLRDSASDRNILQQDGITVVSHRRLDDLVDLILELADHS